MSYVEIALGAALCVCSIGYALVYWILKQVHGAILIISGNRVSETYIHAAFVAFAVTACVCPLYSPLHRVKKVKLLDLSVQWPLLLTILSHLLLGVSLLPHRLALYPFGFSIVIALATAYEYNKRKVIDPWLLTASTVLYYLSFFILIMSPVFFVTSESSESPVHYMEPLTYTRWPCMIVSILLGLFYRPSTGFALKIPILGAILTLWIVLFILQFPTRDSSSTSVPSSACWTAFDVKSLLSGHDKCNELTTDVLNSDFVQEMIQELKPIVSNETIELKDKALNVLSWLDEKETPFYQQICSIYGRTLMPCVVENILPKALDQVDPACDDQTEYLGYRLTEIVPYFMDILGRTLCSVRKDAVHCEQQLARGYLPDKIEQLIIAWTTVAQIPNHQGCLAFQGERYLSTTDRAALLTPFHVLDSCSIAVDDLISLVASFPIWNVWQTKVQATIPNLLSLFEKDGCIPSAEFRNFLEPHINPDPSKALDNVIPRSGQCFHVPNAFAKDCDFAHDVDLIYNSASKLKLSWLVFVIRLVRSLH